MPPQQMPELSTQTLPTFTDAGGDATTTNSGTVVSGSIQTSANSGGNATTTNAGFAGGNISTVTNGGVGNATTTNLGSVSAGIFTDAGTSGDASTSNSQFVSGGVQTIANNGTATTTNSGTINGTASTQTNTGDAVTINLGFINGNISTASNNGNAATTNSGIVGGNVQTTASNGGIATTTNSGTINGNILAIADSRTTLVNSGTVNGGFSSFVTSGGSSVTNSGTISNPGGDAIEFFGGSNTLTLAPGSVINGTVLGNGRDTFQLGGNGASTFDLSTIGPTAQYQGFTTFNKIDNSTWTLTGVFAQTDPWTVQKGTLLVNGDLSNASLTTVTGGTLGGTGKVGNTQINSGGTFAPGTPGVPGTTITVVGNLAFQSGALYLVQVNSTGSTRANVTGTASLRGTVQVAFATGSASKSYDILHSANLEGTTFGGASSNNPNYAVGLSYTATDVLLDVNAQLGLGSGLNRNQKGVANAINAFFNGGGTLPPGFANMFGLAGGNLGSALSQLSGEAATGAERSAFQLMTEFLGLMLDPFVDGHFGGGVGGGGQAIGLAPDLQASLPPDIALAYASVLKAPPKPTFDERWTAWGSVYGGSNTANGDPVAGSNNVTARTFGFAGGMDYHYSPDTIFGFALAGGGTNWGLSDGLGNGRSDAFQAGVYGITRAGPAYVAAALAFTNHWMTTNRAPLGDQLTANFDAQSYGARVETGYRYATTPVPGVIIGMTPYAALQAQDFHTPSYSETDVTGGGFGLSYNAMNATDMRTELGARFDEPALVSGMPLILRARVAWAHDFVSNPALGAVFQSLPGASFIVNGAPMPQNSALISAGAELYLTPRFTLLAKFDGEFAGGSQTYAGSGTLRYTW